MEKTGRFTINLQGAVFILLLSQIHSTWAGAQPAGQAYPPDGFCRGLSSTFAAIAMESGTPEREAKSFGAAGAAALAEGVRTGMVSDVISLTFPTQGGGRVSRANMAEQPVNPPSLHRTAAVVAIALGMGIERAKTAESALSLAELRFVVPSVAQGAEVVAFARGHGGVGAERARAIIQAARAKGVRVSVIWAGGGNGSRRTATAEEAAAEYATAGYTLAMALATSTGGAFVDLSGPSNVCDGSI